VRAREIGAPIPRNGTLREAQELCHEQWLKDDLAEAKSDGAPLWDGKAKLRVRMARLDESASLLRSRRMVSRLTG
jgi:hypothetical protein